MKITDLKCTILGRNPVVRIVTDEIQQFLIGTFLEGAPILPMSNITGDGFDGFYKALTDLVEAIEPRQTEGVFRVPVERAFSAKGYGTIAAGIPASGSIGIGECMRVDGRMVGNGRSGFRGVPG